MKKKVNLIKDKRLVQGDITKLKEDEVIVLTNAKGNIELKELNNGSIKSIADGQYEERTVTATTSAAQVITPSEGKDAMSKVTVNKIETEEKTLTTAQCIAGAEFTPTEGKLISKIVIVAE